MDFSYSISNLRDGYAAKRPAWGGYVKRIDDTQTEGAYTLTFVKRDGTQTVYAVSPSGVVSTSDPATLDPELLQGFMADDWYVGKTADFETARSGTGNVW